MQIDIKGRNVPVTDEMRTRVARRLEKISRQVSPLARAELEVFRERNPSIAEPEVAEATLYLKGTTLRARKASADMQHSLNVVADELARQVKRHRDKRRRRREQRAAAMPGSEQAPAIAS
jgi:putative sigma-54 modulation protein